MTNQASPSDLDAAIAEARRQLAESWGWFLTLGIILLLAGAAAIVFPWVFTVAAKIALGWIFLIGGVVLVVHALSTRGWAGFLWSLLSGLVAVAVGVVIAYELPGSAAWAIGLLVGVNLISTGASFLVLALAGRRARAA